MRGNLVRGLANSTSERRLAAAIYVQALIDARRGDLGAAGWLDEIGPAWAKMLGIEEGAARAWRAADLEQKAPPDIEKARARARRWRKKRRAARGQNGNEDDADT